MTSFDPRNESLAGATDAPDPVCPDPQVDFEAWAAWREGQASNELRELELDDLSKLGEAASAIYERCYDEITAVEAELGIPVKPLDETEQEVAERMVAMQVALAMIGTEPETLNYLRTVEIEEAVQFVYTRAQAIRNCSVAGELVELAETKAREEVACLYERHSRGDVSYHAVAGGLRRRRFEAVRLGHVTMPATPSRCSEARRLRPRERRTRVRSLPTRGDPSRALEDGDVDLDDPEQAQLLRVRLRNGGILEISPDQVPLVEKAIRKWRRASKAGALDDLPGRVIEFLAMHPGETTTGVARGVATRTSRVREVLETDRRFRRVSPGPGRPANAKCWEAVCGTAPLVPQTGTKASSEARSAGPGGERT